MVRREGLSRLVFRPDAVLLHRIVPPDALELLEQLRRPLAFDGSALSGDRHPPGRMLQQEGQLPFHPRKNQIHRTHTARHTAGQQETCRFPPRPRPAYPPSRNPPPSNTLFPSAIHAPYRTTYTHPVLSSPKASPKSTLMSILMFSYYIFSYDS